MFPAAPYHGAMRHRAALAAVATAAVTAGAASLFAGPATAGWKVRLGGGGRPLVVAVDLPAFPASDAQWEANVSFRNLGPRMVRITRIDMLLTPTPDVRPATVENVSRSGGYAAAGDRGAERPPSSLTLRPGSRWDGWIRGSSIPLAGRYGSLRIEYTIGGRPGAYVFPARERPPLTLAEDDEDTPAFSVGTSDNLVAKSVTLRLQASHLAAIARSGLVAIAVPAGYELGLGAAPGAVLGRAEVRAATRVGGRTTLYTGRIVVVGTRRSACTREQPVAAWLVRVRDAAGAGLELPVAVVAQGGTYALTLCFGSRHLVLGGFDLAVHRIFRNPVEPHSYLFDAEVVPLALDGTLLDSGAYELRARENLAAQVTLRGVYAPASGTFSVTGRILRDIRARRDETVDLYVGFTTALPRMKHLATIQTGRKGGFTFTTRIAPPPRYVLAYADSASAVGCPGASTRPGGCLSRTYDGIPSPVEPVRTAR